MTPADRSHVDRSKRLLPSTGVTTAASKTMPIKQAASMTNLKTGSTLSTKRTRARFVSLPRLAKEGQGGGFPLRPGSDGPGLQLTVHVDGVHLLVVEAEQVLDLRALRNRRRVAPHDVLEFLAADVDRPV